MGRIMELSNGELWDVKKAQVVSTPLGIKKCDEAKLVKSVKLDGSKLDESKLDESKLDESKPKAEPSPKEETIKAKKFKKCK